MVQDTEFHLPPAKRHSVARSMWRFQDTGFGEVANGVCDGFAALAEQRERGERCSDLCLVGWERFGFDVRHRGKEEEQDGGSATL